MSAKGRNIHVAVNALGGQAVALLEHVRQGGVVELTSDGRAVALILPVASEAERARVVEALGAPALRGLARYATEDDLMGTGDAWNADS